MKNKYEKYLFFYSTRFLFLIFSIICLLLFSGRKEYGKGYSIQNLKYMSQLAKEFSINEISHQVGGQILWSTLAIVIMPKSKSHEEMLWYINATHKNGWSRAMLLN